MPDGTLLACPSPVVTARVCPGWEPVVLGPRPGLGVAPLTLTPVDATLVTGPNLVLEEVEHVCSPSQRQQGRPVPAVGVDLRVDRDGPGRPRFGGAARGGG